jgi:transcriptional regulator with XRE-family HTH domain
MNASRMRVERTARGWSQAKLAEVTGLTQGRISEIERGLRPKPDEVAVISGVLGIPVHELFPKPLPPRVPKQVLADR